MKDQKGKKQLLGTTPLIKLPFVVGTDEYKKHPYAGLIYLGNLGNEIE